jgi:hypothetical protein
LLTFGRFILFLSFSPVGEKSKNAVLDDNSNVPLGLTERYFRGFWDQTEERAGGNERIQRDYQSILASAQYQ